MSKQFPLAHPQSTPLPRCSFPRASLCAHIWRFPGLSRDWKLECPAWTQRCEHLMPLFPVRALRHLTVNPMHHTSGIAHQILSWVAYHWYWNKYCKPVMKLTEDNALRAAPAKKRSHQSYHCFPVRSHVHELCNQSRLKRLNCSNTCSIQNNIIVAPSKWGFWQSTSAADGCAAPADERRLLRK